MKEIKLKIAKATGKISIETSGYEGSSCLEATKKLEEGLGLKNPEQELKPEYYNNEVQNNQQVGGS